MPGGAEPRAGTGAAEANAHGLPAPPCLFPDPTGFPEPRPAAPSPVPATASQAPRPPLPLHPPEPPRLLAKPWGRVGASPPVPPQPVLSPRSRWPVGRAVTPATSAAAASTSWSEPAPRDASSTAAASSAGGAGPPCAWATTPSTRRTVRRVLGERGCSGQGFSILQVFTWVCVVCVSPPPGHFYCSLHYPNPPSMDLPQDEPPALPDGVSHCKSPWMIRGGGDARAQPRAASPLHCWLCPRMLLLPTHPQMLGAPVPPPRRRHPVPCSPHQQPHSRGESLGQWRTQRMLVTWGSRSCQHSPGGM